jgi:mercuric ion transport protein
MATATNNNKGFIAGLLTATAASLCCIIPVLAFLGGATGLASSFSWIEPFRPYLIGLTVLVFSFAGYQKLKPQSDADCNCETGNKKPFTQSKTFLSIVTVVAALLLAFPYYAKAFYPKTHQVQAIVDNKSDIKQATFKIKGMGCQGCTEEVNSKIAKVKGVINFQTSFEQASSIVKYDGNKTSVDSIASAINSTGYRIVSQIVIDK